MYDALTPLFDQVTDADLMTKFKSEQLRARRGRAGDAGGGPARRRDGRARPLQRPAHHRQLARRRHVGDGLDPGRGPRAAARPGARRRAAGGDRRAQHRRVRARHRPQAVHADQGDRHDDPARRRRGAQDAPARRARPCATTSTSTSRASTPGCKADGGTRPWTRVDIYAANAITGQIFGEGGGDEARRSQFLSTLRKRYGEGQGPRALRRLHRVRRPRLAHDAQQGVPVRQGDRRRQGQRRARRRLLQAGRPEGPRPRRERAPALGEQLPARRRLALGHRAPAVRRRPADRLHVPGPDARGRHQLSRRAGARRDRARLRGQHPDRPRAGLRVEPHVGGLGPDRHLRRDAVRRLEDEVPLQGPLPEDGDGRRGHDRGLRAA